MHDHLQTTKERIFNSSDLPSEGYELGQTESIGLRLEGVSGHDATGRVKDPTTGEDNPYKLIARLRLGGDQTYEDVDLVALSAPEGSKYESTGIPALLRHTDEGVSAVSYGQLASDGGRGVIGRQSALFEDMPDTVSRQHVTVEWDKDTGIFMVNNLDPTNKTIVLPPPTSEDQPASPPDELGAAIAMHPSEATHERTIEDLVNEPEPQEQRAKRDKQLEAARRRRRIASHVLNRTMHY